MAEIWERQIGESSKAYSYFVKYRDLGPERSMDKLRKNLGVKISQTRLEQLSAKYSWVERAAAYDDYIDKKKREEKEKAILEMAERHAKLAVAFQQKVVERLRELDPAELDPRDLSKWLDIAVKVERLSRGEPTEIGKQEVTLPAIVEVVMDEEGTSAATSGPGEGLEK